MVPRPVVLPWPENILGKANTWAYSHPDPAIHVLPCSPSDSDKAKIWEPPF